MNVTKGNRTKVVIAEKEKSNKWLANSVKRNVTTVSFFCTNEIQPILDMHREIDNILNACISELITPKKYQTKFRI